MGELVGVARVGAADWAVYRRMRLAALTEAPSAFGSTWERESQFTEDRWRQRLADNAMFMATVDGTSAGIVGAVVSAESPAHADVVAMWVSPSFRGTGVADRLVEAVVEWADGESVELSLHVTEGNRAAEKLYERHGFARNGEWRPHLHIPDAYDFSMVRKRDTSLGAR